MCVGGGATGTALMRNCICARAEFRERPDDWSAVHEVFAAAVCGGTIEHSQPPAMAGYLFENEASPGRIATLGKRLLDLGARSLSFEPVPEEEWAESWKRFFRPMRIGSTFMVAPSWAAKEAESDAGRDHLIVLDPGQAFGTGDHATTRLCLTMLEAAVKPGNRVCDLGTGTGILAIVASALGASEVYATEVDAPALDAARDNFLRNGVEVRLFASDEVPKEVPQCDVVVANLTSAALILLAPQVRRLVTPEGVWILSGVVPSNWADVEEAANRARFHLDTRYEEDGWIAATFRPA